MAQVRPETVMRAAKSPVPFWVYPKPSRLSRRKNSAFDLIQQKKKPHLTLEGLSAAFQVGWIFPRNRTKPPRSGGPKPKPSISGGVEAGSGKMCAVRFARKKLVASDISLATSFFHCKCTARILPLPASKPPPLMLGFGLVLVANLKQRHLSCWDVSKRKARRTSCLPFWASAAFSGLHLFIKHVRRKSVAGQKAGLETATHSAADLRHRQKALP